MGKRGLVNGGKKGEGVGKKGMGLSVGKKGGGLRVGKWE
jgi:hypothetical protein